MMTDTGNRSDQPQGHRERRSRLIEGVLEALPDAIAVTRGNLVTYVNQEFTRIFGYTAEEVHGRDLAALVVPQSRLHETSVLQQALEIEGRVAMDTVRRTKSGELVDVALTAVPYVEDDAATGMCLTYRDIRDRKQRDDRLQHFALHDPLTNLPNRALFVDRLKLAMARRERRREQGCGVMFLDLDKFKEINDSFGHAAGDAVLIEMASRLCSAIRPEDTASRLSGDEFAILLEHVRSISDMSVVAERITAVMSRPFQVAGRTLDVTASIGVALCGKDHGVPEQLLRDADFAMYRAKQNGGGRYEIFDRTMKVVISHQRERERELRQVLARREYALWYQPYFRLSTGILEGFECLLRWGRQDGSYDSFRELLALAEGAGLAISIHRETMAESCGQLHSWLRDRPGAEFNLCINVSGRQFYHPEIVSMVASAVAQADIDPARLMLEIPETVLSESPDTAVAIVGRLADIGVRIALDNFGSGWAPINFLAQLPISLVKIDPRLTAAAVTGGPEAAVLESLLHLGKRLAVPMVAQRVEQPGELAFLRRIGCEFVQGFLFSPAVNSQAAGDMIERNPTGGWWPGLLAGGSHLAPISQERAAIEAN